MCHIGTNRPIGRPKQYYKYELPAVVVRIVRDHCADFKRKEIAIIYGDFDEDVLNAYKKTNDAIKRALGDIEAPCREFFLSDIADNRGYDKSKSQSMMGHNAYYARKRKVIYDIARSLLLV